jgi:hypothetical protein
LALSLDYFRAPEDDCSNAQSNLEIQNSQVVLRSCGGVRVVRLGPFEPLSTTVLSQPSGPREVREITLAEVLVAKTPFLDRSPGGHSNVLEKRSDESRRLEKYPHVFVL